MVNSETVVLTNLKRQARLWAERWEQLDSLWPAVFIVGLAAALRLFWLTWYSVDVDEAFSLFWARVPLAELIPDLLSLEGDPHPPGYYALLKPWLNLIGVNEVGLRLYSVSAGILFIPLVYAFGRDLFSVRVGLVAALLAAVNPALVYESLDARMYMPAAVFALAGAWTLWRFGRSGRWTMGLSAFILLTIACYHHLAGALVVAGLAGAVLMARLPRRHLAGALAILFLVGVGYIPYAINAWQSSAGGNTVEIRAAPNLAEMMEYLSRWTVVHEAPQAPWLVLFTGFVMAVAVIWGLTRKEYRSGARGFLAACLIIPVILFVVLSSRAPILQPKMLVVTTIAFLLVGVSLPRWGLVVGLLLVFQSWGYLNLWEISRQREDWRSTAQYIQEHAGPNDVVIAHLHFYEEPLDFYYDGQIQAPFGSHLSSYEQVENGLDPYLNAEVLWLAQSGSEITDPDHLLENWLAERYPLVTAQYPNRITLKGFLLNRERPVPLDGTLEIGVDFTNSSRVEGAWIDARSLAPTEEWLHPPSNWLHVTLYATPGEYQLTLEDEFGALWGGNLPIGGLTPQPGSDPGTRLDYDVNLNPDTPPGQYKVVLRAIGAEGPASRVDNGETYLILDTVTITS